MTKYLTGAQVAALAGISASAVSKLKAAADPLHRQAGGYDPATVGAWLYRRALASVGGAGGEGLDLSREQALLARERRKALERAAEIRDGQYLPADAVLDQRIRAGMTLRDAVLAVPGQTAATLTNIDDERVIERRLTAALRDALTRVAEPARGRIVELALVQGAQSLAGMAAAKLGLKPADG